MTENEVLAYGLLLVATAFLGVSAFLRGSNQIEISTAPRAAGDSTSSAYSSAD